MKSYKFIIYSSCAVLSLGVIPSVFAYQHVSARETEPANKVAQEARQQTTELSEQTKESPKEIAQQARDEAQSLREAQREDAATARQTAKSEREESRLSVKEERLDAKKLEICKKRESIVSEKIEKVSEQGVRLLDVFKKIADRTIAFYETKGYTVENYDELASEVDAKYAAAELAVTTVSDTPTFDCSGENPKATLVSFRDAQAAKTESLKEYKTSVKNLIVAVKSAQSSESEEHEVEAR